METSLDLRLREVIPIIQDRIMKQTTYFGIPTLKHPYDAWAYQEILFEAQPDVVLEIGNNCGGSTLALAHLLDAIGKGRVIGLDIDHSRVPDLVRDHPRITLIEGDACAGLERVLALVADTDRVVVIEDSSHTYENTLDVLRTYHHLIRPGDYFIVEDSICWHGLEHGPDPGPFEAIETFVAENDDFWIDRSKESFLITWNPKGYLRRKDPNDPTPPEATAAGPGRPARSLKRTILRFVPPILLDAYRQLRAGGGGGRS